jgi:hypothetical protein
LVFVVESVAILGLAGRGCVGRIGATGDIGDASAWTEASVICQTEVSEVTARCIAAVSARHIAILHLEGAAMVAVGFGPDAESEGEGEEDGGSESRRQHGERDSRLKATGDRTCELVARESSSTVSIGGWRG